MAKATILGKERTGEDIHRMFIALGFKEISGDEGDVKKKLEPQYPAKKRIADAPNVEKQKQEEAQDWLACYSVIHGQHRDSMSLLEEQAHEECDGYLGIAAADRSGSVFNEAIENQVARKVKQTLHLTEELTRRLVGSWKRKRNLTAGDNLVKPRAVEKLSAKLNTDAIDVTWDIPSTGVDKVRLIRYGPGGKGKNLGDFGGRQKRDSDGIKAGSTYRYVATTILGGKETTCRVDSNQVTTPLPTLIVPLRAERKGNVVVVTWDKPTQGYEKVELVRRVQDTGEQDVLGTVPDSPYQDTSGLVKGVSYIYCAYTVYLGQKAPQPACSDVVVIPDSPKIVSQPKLERASIEFEYANASGSSGTRIYRGVNRRPEAGKDEITLNLGSPYREMMAEKGKTYRYMLAPVYNGQPYYDGAVETEAVTVPVDPDLPNRVSAVYDSSKHVVVVSLEASANARLGDEYLVRRYAKGQPVPAQPAAYEKGWTTNLRREDKAPSVGREFFYAVFAKNGEAVAPGNVSSNRVGIYRDVWDVKIVPEDGALRMTWKADEAVDEVEVKRLSPNESTVCSADLRAGFTDRELENGVQYKYQISCRYHVAGAGTRVSRGVVRTETPFRVPGRPVDWTLDVLDNKSSVRMQGWCPQGEEFAVLRSVNALEYEEGDVLKLSDLLKRGDRELLRIKKGEKDIVAAASPNMKHYTALTLSPPLVVVGSHRTLGVKLSWELTRSFRLSHCMKKMTGRATHLRRATGVSVTVEGASSCIRKIMLVGEINCIPEKPIGSNVLAAWTTADGLELEDGSTLEMKLNHIHNEFNGDIHCRLFVDCDFPYTIAGSYVEDYRKAIL